MDLKLRTTRQARETLFTTLSDQSHGQGSVIDFTKDRFVTRELPTEPLEFVEETKTSAPSATSEKFSSESGTEDLEDDTGTVSTEDPVMLAMKATLMEDESDDEQILYPQIDRQSTP